MSVSSVPIYKPYQSIVLILACIVVAALTKLGDDRGMVAHFLISKYQSTGRWFLPEVSHGEYWRLISPIFLHFGLMHILFNSIWLWSLGGVIEHYQKPWKLGLLVLVIGVSANLLQYTFGGSSNFGGMSGVVYGLLGYVWAQGQFNPRAKIVLNHQIMIMMMIWFFLCWTGAFGPVANLAHTGGLVLGVLWGMAEAFVVRQVRAA